MKLEDPTKILTIINILNRELEIEDVILYRLSENILSEKKRSIKEIIDLIDNIEKETIFIINNEFNKSNEIFKELKDSSYGLLVFLYKDNSEGWSVKLNNLEEI